MKRFLFAAVAGLVALSVPACSNSVNDAPPTIAPATPAVSPPVTVAPAGQVRALPVKARSAVFDAGAASLVVLSDDEITIMPAGPPRTVALPGRASAMTGDGHGTVYLSTRGGYLRLDVRSGQVTSTRVAGREDTDFTAIARRSDGRLVLGSADGAVYTLTADAGVAASVRIFARVDALVTQGNTAVVLDRGQTSVTTIDPNGDAAQHALRTGEGATTMAADPVGRVLVADTRGGSLLVFGTDPLMMRQSYPVRSSPYGLVGTRTLVWVSLTASNVVVGYDLATGIPVERVRYPTVRQPDVLAFDDATSTLYVASASGDGVQVIDNAGRPR